MKPKWSPSAELIMEMRALVCRVANGQTPLHARPSATTGDWDLSNSARPADQRKHDYLAVLRAAHVVQAAVEMTIVMAINGALRDGADFAEIGAAEGISRQAARQRHRRRHTKRRVRLVSGPRDGSYAHVFSHERELRWAESAGFWDSNPDYWDDQDDNRPSSVYRAKYGAPEVFEFLHYEDANGNAMAHWDRRPRVHQLARFWFVDSRSVLKRAQEIDPRVKTPSSRVDLATVESLCEVFDPARRAPVDAIANEAVGRDVSAPSGPT